jgi:hypothetical protein
MLSRKITPQRKPILFLKVKSIEWKAPIRKIIIMRGRDDTPNLSDWDFVGLVIVKPLERRRLNEGRRVYSRIMNFTVFLTSIIAGCRAATGDLDRGIM